jgi:myxalamid-type polyketide synthase MxaB
MESNPERLGNILREVSSRIESGNLSPLPRRVFSRDRVAEAFRFLETARHTGKVVVSRSTTLQASRHGVYWITGGTGALGREICSWLVSKGARRIALTSRRTTSSEHNAWLEHLRRSGAQVELYPGDISQPGIVDSLLHRIQDALGPVCGVFHCAGVLDDGMMSSLNEERFESVFRGKARGAWALHEATTHLPLECFVLFSSLASLVGSPGQGNYASANGYLDALAFYRRSLRLPALSIQWGPWSGGGMADRLDSRYQQRITSSGVSLLSPEDAIAALDALLSEGEPSTPVVAVAHANWKLVAQYSNSALYSDIAGVTDSTRQRRGRPELLQLLNAEPENTANVLRTFLRSAAARLLGMPVTEIPMHRPLAELGMDSLMSVEFRNRLGLAVGSAMPSTLLFNYPAVEPLAHYFETRVLSGQRNGTASSGVGGAEDITVTEEDLLRELEEAGY